MSRRSVGAGLPAAAILAGGFTSAHRDPKPLNCDHPRLQTEREATQERERLELAEWTALREVRLRAEILLDTAPESPVVRERREQLRVALERAVFEADRLTDHLRRPTAAAEGAS